jgi:hypothetical protein
MQDSQPKASRRGFFMGAAVTAASGAAVLATSRVVSQQPLEAVAAPLPMPEKGGGYSLSDHVKHYYKTAQI